jgi:predicted nucleotidyltransferase
MQEEIKIQLQKVEHDKNIKILYAVESGSRAWGFASTDSDWDVRYVYIHRPEWYLSIDDKKDSMEEILPNDIDLSGWEIRKALKLFRKSNPPLMEWLRSPLLYKEQGGFANALRGLSAEYFNPKNCLHHYLHMAEGNFREYLQKDMVRTKKYFYVIRPVLACEWIESTNTMAPMEFEILFQKLVKDDELKKEISTLLSRKKSGEELSEEPKIEILNNFLESKISYYQNLVKSFGKIPSGDTLNLNLLFRKTLEETWK